MTPPGELRDTLSTCDTLRWPLLRLHHSTLLLSLARRKIIPLRVLMHRKPRRSAPAVPCDKPRCPDAITDTTVPALTLVSAIKLWSHIFLCGKFSHNNSCLSSFFRYHFSANQSRNIVFLFRPSTALCCKQKMNDLSTVLRFAVCVLGLTCEKANSSV